MDANISPVSDPSADVSSSASSAESFKLELMEKHVMNLQNSKDISAVLDQLKIDPAAKDNYIYGLEGIFEALNRRYNKKSTFWLTEKLDVEAFKRKLLEENH